MKRVILAAVLGTVGTALQAAPGYVTQPGGGPVTSQFGLCWHTGFWTPDMAAEPCDRVPRAAMAPVPVVAAPPPAPAEPPAAAAPAPAPLVAAPPPLEKVTLNSDVLFAFDKAELTDAGKAEIDKVVERVRDARVDSIVLVGHADRIGSDQYNQRLSERRAEAVRAYLQQKSAAQNLQASGKGESQPVTGSQCSGIKARNKLIECLQPDRRVEVEVFGTRTAGAAAGSAGTGATGEQRDNPQPRR